VFALQLAFVGGLIAWAARSFDLESLAGHLRGASPLHLATGFALQLATMALYGVRMAALLDARFGSGFWTVNIGIGLNAVLPFRAGDAAKIVVGRSIFGIPVARLSAATIVEKMLDLAVVLALFAFSLAYGASTLLSARQALGYAVALALALAAILTAVVLAPRGRALLLRLHAVGRFLLEVTEQIRRYSVPRLAGLTLLIWLSNIVVVRVIFDPVAAASGGAFGLAGCVTVLVVAALSVALPGAPAGFGLFEAGVVLVLVKLYGSTPESALATALVYHLTAIAPSLVVLGAFTLRRGFLPAR
jgi:hypothetical protein